MIWSFFIPTILSRHLSAISPIFSHYGSVHSLGMLECEAPFFSNKRDVILAENSVVAIDAYFANMPWGSFRIEDTFIVKSSGVELVTTFNSNYLKRYL